MVIFSLRRFAGDTKLRGSVDLRVGGCTERSGQVGRWAEAYCMSFRPGAGPGQRGW